MALLSLLVAGAAPALAVDPAAVERAAAEEGLGAIAPRLGAAAQDGFTLRPTVGLPLPEAFGTTRLGGPADLPPHQRWPRCAGRPMAFLGQIRPADLSGGGPGGGMLSFFAQVRRTAPGSREWLWAGDCGAAVVVPEGSPIVRRPTPRSRDRLILRPASVALALETSLPAADWTGRLGTPLDDLRLGPLDLARYAALRDRLRVDRPAHRFLGYPEGAHEDPRAFCAGRFGGLPGDWRLLLQLDADRRLGFSVAGGGRLFLLARGSDLDAGRVGRVCSAFDAG